MDITVITETKEVTTKRVTTRVEVTEDMEEVAVGEVAEVMVVLPEDMEDPPEEVVEVMEEVVEVMEEVVATEEDLPEVEEDMVEATNLIFIEINSHLNIILIIIIITHWDWAYLFYYIVKGVNLKVPHVFKYLSHVYEVTKGHSIKYEVFI